jgi:dihydropteroate synthase
VESGAQIIRAHDVAETVQAVRMTEAVLAQKKI